MKSERAYVMTERARSTQETGERILDATIALFAELPYAQLTLRAVADRADVTVQTVIRRFGDKKGLTAAAAARSSKHIVAQRSAAPVGDLGGAVDILVAHYEEAGDLALRLLSEEQSAPQLAELAEMGRGLHREWCARVFAPTLGRLRGADRTRRAAQLVAICDVYTWKLLRRDAGLNQRQVATALIEMLEPLTAKG
ncbi:MAG TPA: TetR/AcrR family transcriptional regulator [Lapillicoccus sp.]|nr:TetR/AcrR family transcriptional regulator [Lapillicoccus sp.]